MAESYPFHQSVYPFYGGFSQKQDARSIFMDGLAIQAESEYNALNSRDFSGPSRQERQNQDSTPKSTTKILTSTKT